MTSSAPALSPQQWRSKMFNPYPFYGYPPPNYPPMNPIPPDIEARATQIAMKLVSKEKRKKEKEEERKVKAKADDKKKAEERKRNSFNLIEWYILGALSYPFIGPLYKMVQHYMGVQ
jgi:hypothetical protein